MVISRSVFEWEGDFPEVVVEMSPVLLWLSFLWRIKHIYIYVKIYQIFHIKYVQLIVWPLYLNAKHCIFTIFIVNLKSKRFF